MQLPETLRASIETLLQNQPASDLARHYEVMSRRYRREDESASLQVASEGEALAYVAARFPATFGAVSQVCRQTALSLPDFAPRTLLDVGAGPGTATLAALDHWPGLEHARLVEPNACLQALSRRLLDSASAEVRFEKTNLDQAALPSLSADLVLSSYVLNELPSTQLETTILRLWAATKDVFILVEPGTPQGYGVILAARSILLAAGAQLAAPCPHNLACPLAGSAMWCHMSARIERSSFHRLLKNQSGLGYEDEKFSYLVATRLQPDRTHSRVLGHPRGQKIVELELCEKNGVFLRRNLSRRDPGYKTARKLRWGDRFDPE